ncbi:hypothetical protein Btru_020277 [Bulinus truncatus]|nr:hypothetical protein Btru_020277 [Bulinus truncatus]
MVLWMKELCGDIRCSVKELCGDIRCSVKELCGDIRCSVKELCGDIRCSVKELCGDIRCSVKEGNRGTESAPTDMNPALVQTQTQGMAPKRIYIPLKFGLSVAPHCVPSVF